MTSSDAWDVVVLGSGIAGLAGALAAHELGLRPIVLEKASTLGGGTVNSYGLIWVGQNHLAQAAGYSDTRDETIAYMRFLGGGSLDDDRMSTFVDRSPEALKFFEKCGVRFRVVRGVTDRSWPDSAVWRSNFQEASASGKSRPVAHVRKRRVCGITVRRPEINVECEDEFSATERGGFSAPLKGQLLDPAGPHTHERGITDVSPPGLAALAAPKANARI